MGGVLMKLYYFAHPYRGDKVNNFERSKVKSNKLLDLGYIIYSPVTQTHPWAMQKQRGDAYWMETFFPVIWERCDGIILAPGWEDSEGCCVEKKWFEDHDKEVLYYEEVYYEKVVKHDG